MTRFQEFWLESLEEERLLGCDGEIGGGCEQGVINIGHGELSMCSTVYD